VKPGVAQGFDEVLERGQLDIAEIHHGERAHVPSVACGGVL
jgi:hypothetical protein